MTARFHVPIAAGEREVAAELQSMLVDLLDLALIGKQAHWNVEGRQFRSLHGELDELVESWHALADDVAERAVALGAAPDGQAETIVGSSEIAPLPGGHLDGAEVAALMGDRLAEVTARARADDADRRARPGQRARPHRRRRGAGEAALDAQGPARRRLTWDDRSTTTRWRTQRTHRSPTRRARARGSA